jgi:hypothetical protein
MKAPRLRILSLAVSPPYNHCYGTNTNEGLYVEDWDEMEEETKKADKRGGEEEKEKTKKRKR